MPVLRGPLPNDEPNAVLNRERAAELQEVQSAIGASRELAGEVIGYDRKAEHCLREGQSADRALHPLRRKVDAENVWPVGKRCSRGVQGQQIGVFRLGPFFIGAGMVLLDRRQALFVARGRES
jgi:hypothetical protein